MPDAPARPRDCYNSPDASRLTHRVFASGKPKWTAKFRRVSEPVLADFKVSATWKAQAKAARGLLKTFLPEEELKNQLQEVHNCVQCLMRSYEDGRKLQAPDPEILRKVDCAVQVSEDIDALIKKRLEDVKKPDFNPEVTLFNIRASLDKAKYPSVFSGITESQVSPSSDRSSTSKVSRISSSKVDAAAALAARKAELQSVHEIQEQSRKIKEEENKLERLKAEKEVKIAEARFKVYEEEEEEQNASLSTENLEGNVVTHISHYKREVESSPDAPKTSNDMATVLLKAFQESISLGRLPVPEPSTFSGNPMQFTEWKNAFSALIERKNIRAADKLFYLKKYTAGAAAKMIQGAFLRSDELAYQDAWSQLTRMFGDPFIIQRAFREKISRWPNVGERDPQALRDFSDFLIACNDAMPHVKGLSILNDCEENRKMVNKLPEWVARRWNRRVTNSLKNGEYPSFKEFSDLIAEEAEVVCNPITSPLVLDAQENPKREIRRPNHQAMAIQASRQAAASSSTPQIQTDNYPAKPFVSCTFCNGPHSIHKCFKFEGKSAEEKKQFVQETKLCFGCLRKGHQSKDCKRRATCAKCKRSHPTPLHEDRSPHYKGPAKEGNELASAVSCCATEGGNTPLTSMIVPVWVAAGSNPAREVLTYAMLDTQSDTSFMLNTTAESLGSKGQPVQMKLATMTSSSTVSNCMLLKDITVRGMHSEKAITIPKLYTSWRLHPCREITYSHF
ncbi:uncharacterized protein LOC119723991 [Patiria miniata]|uniref:CCHC-type domain-containing protein n=1 Tax=Patiria miniata TaxID=46514 RepID=A0A913ZIG2_PATMI|nr:uncharacterized protein LOC119723991 [Patiria miniata]